MAAPQLESNRIWSIVVNIAEEENLKLRAAMNKNFGLTESDFLEMSEKLKQGDRFLFEQTFLAHFDDCMNFLKQTYRASHEDAYDASMDALLEFCKRLEAGKINYGNLRFLFTRMAGQIYFRRKKKQMPAIEPDVQIAIEEEEVSEEELQVLQKVLGDLCEDCTEIIKAFYYYDISLKDLALKYDKTPAALRKQKQRCMEKLKNLFKKHL